MATTFFKRAHKVTRSADFTTLSKDLRASFVQEKMDYYFKDPTNETQNEVQKFMALNQLCIDGKRPLIYDENRKRIKYVDDIEVSFTVVLPYGKLTGAEKLTVCEKWIRENDK